MVVGKPLSMEASPHSISMCHMSFSVEINLLSCFEHFEDTLLGECRRKDNWEVGKWSHSLANCGLECCDYLFGLYQEQGPIC